MRGSLAAFGPFRGRTPRFIVFPSYLGDIAQDEEEHLNLNSPFIQFKRISPQTDLSYRFVRRTIGCNAKKQ